MGVQGDPPAWRYSGNPWAEAWEEGTGRPLKLGVLGFPRLGCGLGLWWIPWRIQPQAAVGCSFHHPSVREGCVEPGVSSKGMGMDGAGPAGMQVHALHSSSQHHSPCPPHPLKLPELLPFPPGWCWHILPCPVTPWHCWSATTTIVRCCRPLCLGHSHQNDPRHGLTLLGDHSHQNDPSWASIPSNP